MKKKTLALSLAICLIFGLLSGCGQTGNTAQNELNSEPEPAVQETDAVNTEAGTKESGLASTLPFSDEPVTLSLWTRSPSGNMAVMSGSYEEYEIFNSLEEKSNVHIEWKEYNNEAASTQFNLMCASGEYTDIMSGVGALYAGGIFKAYEDGVIADMKDLIAECAPCYSSLLAADDSIYRECINDDGSQLAFYSINDEPDMAAGLFIRQDWLNEQGLSIPETYDELKTVLTAFKDAYNCEYPLLITESCVPSDSGDLTAGFGISGFNVKEQNRYHLFLQDGKVTSSLVQDSYRDYIAYMAELYQAGLLGSDFYTISSDPFQGVTDQMIVNSQSGVFKLNTRGMDNILSNAVDAGFDITPLPNIGQQAGTINHFSDAALINTNASACISTTCAYPEAAVKWLDYWYSDEGMLAKNYGVEGESFELVNGVPQFTEMLINNEWGVSVDTAISHYNIQNVMVGRTVTNLTWDYFTELQKEAKTLWKTTCDSEQVLPGSLSLTSDESLRYSYLFADISTYVSETIPKFIIGYESLDNWDDYLARLNEMGVDECIQIYQQAYDRYLNR